MTGASVFFVFVGIFFGIALVCAICSDCDHWDLAWEKTVIVVLMAVGLFISGIFCAKYYDKDFAMQLKNIEYHHESTSSARTY